jgi:hypothetical protein
MDKTIFQRKAMLRRKNPTLPSQNSPKPKRVPRGFSLVERDFAINKAVFAYRALTAPLIEQLFFPAPKGKPDHKTHSNCQRRLRILSSNEVGFLLARQQLMGMSGRKPLVYWSAERGIKEIAIARGVDVKELQWDPRQHEVSPLFLDHLLATNAVRIAVTLAVKKHEYKLLEWRDDKTLKREHTKDKVTLTGKGGATEQAAILPDGYFVLDIGEEIARFLLEIDRATETGQYKTEGRRDWARKIRVYGEYLRPEGLYEKRYGTKAGRVLTVTTGEVRLSNLKRITEEQGGKSRYWFTTQQEATTQDILQAPIWRVAGREGVYPLVETK